MNTETTFQPIRLFLPDAAELDRLTTSVKRLEKGIAIIFRLSSKPHAVWVNFFVKAWRFWYGNDNVPLLGAGHPAVTVNCLPLEVREVRQMLVATIDEANRMSAPFIRCEAARIAAGRKRNAKMYELERKQSSPIFIPDDRDGDVLLNALYLAQRKQKETLEKEIAQAELKQAIDEMINDDLLDAMSRTVEQ